MGKAYSQDLRERVLNFLEMNNNKKAASVLFKIGIASIYSWIKRKKGHKNIQKALWGKSLWSSSYFVASCGGAPLGIIQKYIESQKTPE